MNHWNPDGSKGLHVFHKINELAGYCSALVDDSPSPLRNSATWETSGALLPFLHTVTAEPASWERSDTIRGAIEIQGGRVRNEAIHGCHGRAEHDPHEVAGSRRPWRARAPASQ